MNKGLLIAVMVLLPMIGCSFQREPGPVERIGRAIDDIRKSVDEISPGETADQRRAREDQEWRRRQDDYYQRNRDRGSNLYGETDEERAARDREYRDREYWENPIGDSRPSDDRY